MNIGPQSKKPSPYKYDKERYHDSDEREKAPSEVVGNLTIHNYLLFL